MNATLIQEQIRNRAATVGIIGLGYVGLPLALEFAKQGFHVVGYDVDESKISALNSGTSYIKHIESSAVKECVDAKSFIAVSDETKVREMDAVIICVPTPLTPQREPDLSYVRSSCEMIAKHLRAGQLVSLESTTYPGTTEEVMRPILETSGLEANKDFYLVYSPEREDPNNLNHTTATIPKVIGCDCPQGLQLAQTLYDSVVAKTVAVSSTKVAEATKLLENIYRSVNIAMVNELKVLFTEMDINVWEVIEAAATKPFGFQAFYPGPGLGGHCIPIDPFYLTWKAREYDMSTRFIELAGEVNAHMPKYVCTRVMEALNTHERPMKNAKLLMLGMAYKRDVDDMRESPALKLIEMFEEAGAQVDFYDPFIAQIPETRNYQSLSGRESVDLTPEVVASYDGVVVVTDHSNVPYDMVTEHAQLIVDTRNVIDRSSAGNKLFTA